MDGDSDGVNDLPAGGLVCACAMRIGSCRSVSPDYSLSIDTLLISTPTLAGSRPHVPTTGPPK